jgi:hypothetical protein
MKDPAARTITLSVKVNKTEHAMLRALAGGGTAGKGLRRLIDKYLLKKQPTTGGWQQQAWEAPRPKEEQR